MRRWTRALALCAGAAITGVGLWWSVHGGGVAAVLLALAGWAALTALASGVVRSLRLAQPAAPAPPVAAASLGALCAGLALGDLGRPAGARHASGACSSLLTAPCWCCCSAGSTQGPRAPGCRAGLFDCSLPAWPTGAWRDLRQWPTLLAGLAMLPMMAALPLMAAWCSAQAVAPQAMVLLHLAAMFGPPLLLQAIGRALVAAHPVGRVHRAAGGRRGLRGVGPGAIEPAGPGRHAWGGVGTGLERAVVGAGAARPAGRIALCARRPAMRC